MKYLKFAVVVIVIGGLFFAIEGSSLPQLLYWNTGELVGANIVILVILGLAIYLIKLAWDYTIGKKSKVATIA